MANYLGHWPWPEGSTSILIDAAGEKAAHLFVPGTTGTLDQLAIHIAAASNAQDLVTTIEAIGSDGFPDGTPIATSDTWTPVQNTWSTVTFTVGAAVTAGTRYAAVTTWSSTVGNLNVFGGHLHSGMDYPGYIYPAQFTSAWSEYGDRSLCLAIRYDNATWEVPLGCWPFGVITSATLSSSNNELGFSFTPANSGVFHGVHAAMAGIADDANDALAITLYDTDGSSALATLSTSGALFNNTDAGQLMFPFGWVSLTSGTTYYIGVKGTGSGSITQYQYVAYSDAVAAVAFGGFTDCTPLTRPNGGGAWSGDTTYPALFPLITETVGGAVVGDVYHADVVFTRDSSNNRDEYTATWFKNGVPQTSGVTVPKIQIIKRADGTDLVADTAMSEGGSAHVFYYNHSSLAITAGEAVVVQVTATIDAATRTWRRVVSRDP